MSRPIASVSLDLDNEWAYLRSHGRDAWAEYPTYLPMVAERIAAFLKQTQMPMTVFVVGKDLEREENRAAVKALTNAGCEIANHSYNHWPWMEALSLADVRSEIIDTEQAIEQLTGVRPVGFRAPGFSWSPEVLAVLAERGYEYDSSTFPTCIGPLASWYVRLTKKNSSAENNTPQQQFASVSDALRTLRPHVIQAGDGDLVELPVTTMPLTRLPIHLTYLTFLRQKSAWLTSAYWRSAINLCRLRGVAPSLLLHPLDFLGQADAPDLDFFPGMKLTAEVKLNLLAEVVSKLQKHYDLQSVRDHAKTARL